MEYKTSEEARQYGRDHYKKYGKPKRVLKYGFRPSENRKEYNRLQLQNRMHKNPIARLIAVGRYRAKKQGQEFTITQADLVVLEFCPILGLKLQFNPGKRKPSTYSLDRIDNSKGYIPGNVAVISWKANRIKSDLLPHEVVKLYEYIMKIKVDA